MPCYDYPLSGVFRTLDSPGNVIAGPVLASHLVVDIQLSRYIRSVFKHLLYSFSVVFRYRSTRHLHIRSAYVLDIYSIIIILSITAHRIAHDGRCILSSSFHIRTVYPHFVPLVHSYQGDFPRHVGITAILIVFLVLGFRTHSQIYYLQIAVIAAQLHSSLSRIGNHIIDVQLLAFTILIGVIDVHIGLVELPLVYRHSVLSHILQSYLLKFLHQVIGSSVLCIRSGRPEAGRIVSQLHIVSKLISHVLRFVGGFTCHLQHLVHILLHGEVAGLRARCRQHHHQRDQRCQRQCPQ